MISQEDVTPLPSSLLRKSSTILSLTSEALCIAVKTALRLADKTDKNSPDPETQPLPEFTLDQVSWHDTSSDCWVVIYDNIYDISEFLDEHPGGSDVLLEYAGRDATLAFRGVGHSKHAWRALDKYLIGVLPASERIFNKLGERAVESKPFTSSLAATC